MADHPKKRVGLFLLREKPGALDGHQPRAGNARREYLGVTERGELIFLSPNDQGLGGTEPRVSP